MFLLKMLWKVQILCIQRHTKFSKTLEATGGKHLKRILKYLFCTKYNGINPYHSDVTKACSL